MVLSTDNNVNNYHTDFVLLVMLLMALIAELTVKIRRLSYDQTIAYILQHLFKSNYFQAEHYYYTSQNIHTPYFCFCLLILFPQPEYTAVCCSLVIFIL